MLTFIGPPLGLRVAGPGKSLHLMTGTARTAGGAGRRGEFADNSPRLAFPCLALVAPSSTLWTLPLVPAGRIVVPVPALAICSARLVLCVLPVARRERQHRDGGRRMCSTDRRRLMSLNDSSGYVNVRIAPPAL